MAEGGTILRTADFTFDLPPELIAQTPSPNRGDSRMLVVERNEPASSVADRRFADLLTLLSPGDLLVLNTTKVRHARLLGTRPSGAAAEVLLIAPAGDGTWVAMGSPGSALRPGKRIELGGGFAVETVEVLDQGYQRVRIAGGTAEQAMAVAGRLPLPPYIGRDPTSRDDERYQTVFAEREGSVAAPTAGLHFTAELLDAVLARGVRIGRLDLEVGPGTFKPVDVDDPADHPMHPERYEIPGKLAAEVAATRARRGSVWAVGTTVVRALESSAGPGGTVRSGSRETRLLITPGYEFQVVDRLVTNFHLPRSTLLMLVCAFAGYDTTMAAYRQAVERRYRFYSYGDAMVVL